jgi:hypothetical protein
MRRRRSAPTLRGVAIVSLTAALVGGDLSAQPMLDLNQRALAWSQGEYVAPLVCEFPHGVRRGVRKLRVLPGPSHVRPPSNKLSFPGMELPEGTRCTSDTGAPQPNVTGALLFQLPSISRPDIADHEFSEALERDGGFTFKIRAGTLQIAGEPHEFEGGSARFTLVRPGTDAYRRLLDVPALRKLELHLEAPDGAILVLDLAQTPGRKPR